MIPNVLTEISEEAAGRYESLTDLFQALFSRALSSPKFGYAGQIVEIVTEAHKIANQYYKDEHRHMAERLLEVAIEAHRRVRDKLSSIDAEDLSEAALEHLKLTHSYLADEIGAQIQRDIATLRLGLQRAALEVTMIARTRQMSERDALWIWRMNHSETLNFHFPDRAARRTPSRTFTRTIWRASLLSIFNETTAMTLADHGVESAAVLKFEDGVEKLVDVISLSGAEDAMDYAAAVSTYFHPNANTYLNAEPDDV